MPLADYNEIIQRDIRPGLVDTVVYDGLLPFTSNFTTAKPDGGDRITTKYRLGYTSNAAFYDKSDVDPASSTQDLAKPWWTKVFSHGACEVHGIDISNNAPGDNQLAPLSDAIAKETEALMDVNNSAIYSQIKADVSASGVVYSDAALARTTYPLLVSYTEATNATITLAYFRGAMRGVTLNKASKPSDYLVLMEGSTYFTFKPLATALHAWNVEGKNGQHIDSGHQDIANFEGFDIAHPSEFTNMTTGDVLFLRRKDVVVVTHRPLEIKLVESGRDSIKAVLRTGVNVYVDNPYLQGKMIDKD